MAWTAPLTWASNQLCLAAQLNQQLRDNFLELDAAKATQGGRMIVSSAANSLIERTPMSANDLAYVTTSSFSYVNLGGGSPSVTLTTGTSALVVIAAEMWNDSVNGQEFCSYKVSGATTIAASDDWSMELSSLTANDAIAFAACHLRDDLNPGVNTFTMQYRTGGGLAQYDLRTILVMPQ